MTASKTLRKFLLSLALLGCTQSALSESAPASSDAPVFVYSFTGNPRPDNNAGLVGEALLQLGESPNKPLLAELNRVLGKENQQARFEQVFGCLFKEEQAQQCKRVVLLSEQPFPARVGIPSDELAALLQEYKSERVWILRLTEQFHVGGYNLGANAVESYLNAAGERKYRPISAMYMEPYSDRLDAMSRGLPPDARGVKPRFGSKEAKSNYWLASDPSRLQQAVAAAPVGVADLLALMIHLPRESVLVSAPQDFKQLPKLSQLRAEKKASCTAAYCSTRVFRDLGDRLYLEADWRQPWLISAPRWGL